MGADANNGLILLYDIAAEQELIAQMQKVSLDTSSPYGLSPSPVVGSREWWDEIESGRRGIHWIDGLVDRVWWGSMADYPSSASELRTGRLRHGRGSATDGGTWRGFERD